MHISPKQNINNRLLYLLKAVPQDLDQIPPFEAAIKRTNENRIWIRPIRKRKTNRSVLFTKNRNSKFF
jgi:hypothetical protein